MTSADLIWRLIELILKDKEIKSDADEQKKIRNNLGSEGTTTPHFFFYAKKELNATTHLVRSSI